MHSSINTYRQLLDMSPDDADHWMAFVLALMQCASITSELGSVDESVDCRREAVSIFQGLTDDQSPGARAFATQLADALDSLALSLARNGNPDEAVAAFQESISIRDRLADQAPDDPEAHRRLALTWMRLGGVLYSHDRPEEAVEPLRRSITIYSFVASLSGPDDPQARKDLARAHVLLGRNFEVNDKSEEAVTHLQEAVSAPRELVNSSPDDWESKNGLAMALAVLGGAHSSAGQPERAVEHLSGAANIFHLLAELDPTEKPEFLIGVLQALSEELRDLGRTDEADESEARARDLASRYPDEDDE